MNKRDKWEDWIEKAHQRYEDALEKAAGKRLGQLLNILVPEKPRPECSRNIICECSRRSCPAYTVSIHTYTKRFKQNG